MPTSALNPSKLDWNGGVMHLKPKIPVFQDSNTPFPLKPAAEVGHNVLEFFFECLCGQRFLLT